MCGRLTIIHPTEAMARLFGAALANDLPQGPNYNLCPTQTVAAVTGGAARHLRPMRWGFIPAWYKSPTDGPLIINARADTVAVKPAFREAIRARRCILPASGFTNGRLARAKPACHGTSRAVMAHPLPLLRCGKAGASWTRLQWSPPKPALKCPASTTASR